jgi:hypothetical protein
MTEQPEQTNKEAVPQQAFIGDPGTQTRVEYGGNFFDIQIDPRSCREGSLSGVDRFYRAYTVLRDQQEVVTGDIHFEFVNDDEYREYLPENDENGALFAESEIKKRRKSDQERGIGMAVFAGMLSEIQRVTNIRKEPIISRVDHVPAYGLDQTGWDELFVPVLTASGYSMKKSGSWYKVCYPE